MEINSTSGISELLQDMASSQARDIKKTVMLEQMGIKVATAAKISEDLILSLANGGYQPDSVIPEDSTISYHV